MTNPRQAPFERQPHNEPLYALNNILHGNAAIAAYLGVAEQTVSRWHVRFNQETDPQWTLPLMKLPVGKVRGWHVWTSKSAIDAWLLRWHHRDTRERQAKLRSAEASLRQRKADGTWQPRRPKVTPTTPTDDNGVA